MHFALLAHAAAVDEFRQGGYKGKIGIKVDGGVSLPLNPANPADQAAAARAMDFVGFPSSSVQHTITQHFCRRWGETWRPFTLGTTHLPCSPAGRSHCCLPRLRSNSSMALLIL